VSLPAFVAVPALADALGPDPCALAASRLRVFADFAGKLFAGLAFREEDVLFCLVCLAMQLYARNWLETRQPLIPASLPAPGPQRAVSGAESDRTQ
jgi:hypothetical protein